MQTVTRETKFKTTAKKDEIKFKIDDVNPEIIIKIVSDTYPNPRRTVSTEYVQNGADSHRWANKSHIPLDIQLPTKLDPNFVVRDYGIGMSEKDIIDTFAYVFRSTKNENDEDAGGFGIGKLAFGRIEPWLMSSSYADAFTHAVAAFETWGFWYILLAGFTPIPYKMFTISAGVVGMPFLVMKATTISKVVPVIIWDVTAVVD
jgi:hypothetical protein